MDLSRNRFPYVFRSVARLKLGIFGSLFCSLSGNPIFRCERRVDIGKMHFQPFSPRIFDRKGGKIDISLVHSNYLNYPRIREIFKSALLLEAEGRERGDKKSGHRKNVTTLPFRRKIREDRRKESRCDKR